MQNQSSEVSIIVSVDLIFTKEPEVPQTLESLTQKAKAFNELIKARVLDYKVENYSGDNVEKAKADRAELNKAKKTLNDKRIALEKEFMKPFEAFKAAIAEGCTAIDSAAVKIDQVVKDVEQKEKEEKRKIIEAFWAQQDFDLVTLDRVFDQAWLNKTAKIKDVQSELMAKIEKIKSDLAIIERMGEEDAKAFYLRTLNLDSALKEADVIKAAREKLAKPSPVAVQPELPEVPIIEEEEPNQDQPSLPVHQANEDHSDYLTRTFWVKGTRAQLEALNAFLMTGVDDYGKVE